MRTCTYQGIRTVSFSEIFANVLIEWSLEKLSKRRNYAKLWFKVIRNYVSSVFIYFHWSAILLRGFRFILFRFFLKNLSCPLNQKPKAKVEVAEVFVFLAHFMWFCYFLFSFRLKYFVSKKTNNWPILFIVQHLLWLSVESNNFFIWTFCCTDISQVIICIFWKNLMEVMTYAMEVTSYAGSNDICDGKSFREKACVIWHEVYLLQMSMFI